MGILNLMYITNNPDVALIAQRNGVDRIWIDLETEGKAERQKDRDTVKSRHSIKDIQIIKPLLVSAQMLVRVNPWSERSKKEIDAVIEAGADIVMLPMWRTAGEVHSFLDAVNGRCKTLLLLETMGAENSLDEVLKLKGVDEIHIGLNDLHLEYKLRWMFELLSNGKIDEICAKIRAAGIPFGFGGIGMMGGGLIPSPEEIINEHFRLGSTGVILSRSFCNYEQIGNLKEIDKRFSFGVKAIRNQEKIAAAFSMEDFLKNKEIVRRGVEQTVRQMGSEV